MFNINEIPAHALPVAAISLFFIISGVMLLGVESTLALELLVGAQELVLS